MSLIVGIALTVGHNTYLSDMLWNSPDGLAGHGSRILNAASASFLDVLMSQISTWMMPIGKSQCILDTAHSPIWGGCHGHSDLGRWSAPEAYGAFLLSLPKMAWPSLWVLVPLFILWPCLSPTTVL
ncbi:MAG: hypothetical protein IPI20_19800 [Rhodoferax sp.]|nr:hypothetical protein [Rhodoferax sp.]